jgi:hypothetical protein
MSVGSLAAVLIAPPQQVVMAAQKIGGGDMVIFV